MKIHELKTRPQFMGPILDGRKAFELRYDDRGFEVGDVLHLREWCPESETYSGREALAEVTYILLIGVIVVVPTINPWVAMSIKLLKVSP